MRQLEGTTLWGQAQRSILDGVGVPARIWVTKTCHKMSVKEHKVKNACGSRMPSQNPNARGKTVTEKPGKSKATESNQGRAQRWWRTSRTWEARVERRWQGKVVRKCKILQWGKTTTTTTSITKTSWRFSQAKYHGREFCCVHLRSKLSQARKPSKKT